MITTGDNNGKLGIWKHKMDQPRFLIAGAGAIVEKQKATWDAYDKRGVQIYAADIRDNPSARSVLPSSARFFNIKKSTELEELVHDGLEQPFDVAYLSTFPALHIATAIRLDFIARSFIFPKPVDSNYGFMATLNDEGTADGPFGTIVSRSRVHDHYRNKPLTRFLRGHVEALHRQYGFLRNVRLYITEHRTINDEWRRRQSLECGMMLDLAPHALSVLFETIPSGSTWVDKEGNNFRRASRRFEIVSVARARDNHCILHTQESETCAVVHLRVHEHIQFIPVDDPQSVDGQDRHFDVCIVVGKGLSVQDEGTPQDLKAIEMEFDGQSVRGNFDTNAISGVIDKELQRQLEKEVDVRHRGLNLPLLQLADHDFSIDKLCGNGYAIEPFQSFNDAFQIASLIEQCRRHHTAQNLVRYQMHDKVANVVNRCVGAKLLDSMWAIQNDPTHLLFGEVPDSSIP